MKKIINTSLLSYTSLLLLHCSYNWNIDKTIKHSLLTTVEAVISSSSSSPGTRLTGVGSRFPEKSIFYNTRKKNKTELLLQQHQSPSSSRQSTKTVNINNNSSAVITTTIKTNLCIEIDEKDNNSVLLNIIESSKKNSSSKVKILNETRIKLSSTYNSSARQLELDANIIISKKVKKDKRRKVIPIEGIYGIYNLPPPSSSSSSLCSSMYLVLICDSEIIVDIPNVLTIKRIVRMEIIKLPSSSDNSRNVTSTTVQQQRKIEEYTQLRLLRKVIRQHELYYISPSSTDNDNIVKDITHTIQRSLLLNNTNTSSASSSDTRFYWNENLHYPLVNTLKDCCSTKLSSFLIPCTSAYVGINTNISFNSKQQNYTQILISRRSKNRAGTRFTRRGCDSLGNVANFAETEQILLIPSSSRDQQQEIYSHVQIRGSIPLLWNSPANIHQYNPRVNIELNPIQHANVMILHLVNLWSIYGNDIVFMNLIDTHKDQGRLGRAFDSVLSAITDVYKSNSDSNKASMIWFDFHKECKGENYFKNLMNLLYDVQDTLQNHGYFSATLLPSTNNETKIHSIQNGVIRSNCMDCLDRTNVVQTIFARWILFQQFHSRLALSSTASTSKQQKPTVFLPKHRHMPIEYIKQFKPRNTKYSNPLSLPWKQGESSHRFLWADNADHISTLYAGTNALKGDYTRYGKRTTKGQLNDGVYSLTRYYKNNFEDGKRQHGIDLMIGDYDDDSEMIGTSSNPSSVVDFLSLLNNTTTSITKNYISGLDDHDNNDEEKEDHHQISSDTPSMPLLNDSTISTLLHMLLFGLLHTLQLPLFTKIFIVGCYYLSSLLF